MCCIDCHAVGWSPTIGTSSQSSLEKAGALTAFRLMKNKTVNASFKAVHSPALCQSLLNCLIQSLREHHSPPDHHTPRVYGQRKATFDPHEITSCYIQCCVLAKKKSLEVMTVSSILPEAGRPHPQNLSHRTPGLCPASPHTGAVCGHVLVGTGQICVRQCANKPLLCWSTDAQAHVPASCSSYRQGCQELKISVNLSS